jgi:hypothetical protein
MPKSGVEGLTEQQQKWFASVRAGLETRTGKTLEQWVEIAKTCPETAPRARLKWFKDTHGLMQNSAGYVLGVAFPSTGPSWDDADALREALWTDPAQRAIYEAVAAAVADFDGLVVGQRKGYSAWSRAYQFCAVKPVKGGARLGLAVTPDTDSRLQPAKPNEGWSERLKATLPLGSAAEIDAGVQNLLKLAFERS